MLIKKGFIIICVALGLCSLEPARAASVLTDTELAVVTGGGVNLPQDQQKPNQNSTEVVSVTDLPTDDGMDRPSDAVAVFQSEIDIDYQRDLLLGESAQQDLRALNLENQVSSDVTGTTNIIGGRLLAPAGTRPGLNINQTNQLKQLHRQQGSLNSSPADYSYEATVHTSSSYENYSRSASLFVEQRDRSETFHHHQSDWDVAVGKVSLPGFSANNPAPFKNEWRHEIIPDFKVGGTVDAGWFGEYGAEASYSGLDWVGPTASFDGLEAKGDDLVINATLELPALDLGDLTFKGCIGECLEGKIDLGSVGGTNIFDILKAVDDEVAPSDAIGFSSDGIILKDMGSILSDELNLNTGFVFAGKGHFKSMGPVTVNIGGDASLNATAVLDFSIDLNNDIIRRELGTDKWTIDGEFDLINVTIPFTFLDLEIDPFEIEFDGVVVAQLGSGEVSTDELAYSSTDTLYLDNSRITHLFQEEVDQNSFSESVVHTGFSGGQMTGAEAELLALSEGALKVSNNSSVSLSESAQRNMHIIHGVNAVSSIAANSLNVGQMPSFVTGTTRMRQVSLHQQNHFIQQR